MSDSKKLYLTFGTASGFKSLRFSTGLSTASSSTANLIKFSAKKFTVFSLLHIDQVPI